VASQQLKSLDEPTLWFEEAEYRARLACVQAAMAERGLDYVLAFEPESLTYLTGFYSMQYGMFGFVIVPQSGEPTMVMRSVLAYQLSRMAVYERRHWWYDGEKPGTIVVRALREQVPPRATIGIELSAWTLNARLYKEMDEALGEYSLVDASGLVESFRLIKSPAELALIRGACRAAEGAMTVAMDVIRDGCSERELAAEVAKALVVAGSDSSDVSTIASGPPALHLGCSWGDRVMCAGDPVFVEVDADVHRYHGRFIRSARIGSASEDELRLAETLLAIQDRAIAAVGPGIPASVPDAIYREGIVGTGAVEHYPNKTFYSVGFMLSPTGYEHLEATPGASWTFRPGMTFHTYFSVKGLNFSEFITVTDTGVDVLTHFPRRLFVK
jgi:Xaa-Pro dipeptidase